MFQPLFEQVVYLILRCCGTLSTRTSLVWMRWALSRINISFSCVHIMAYIYYKIGRSITTKGSNKFRIMTNVTNGWCSVIREHTSPQEIRIPCKNKYGSFFCLCKCRVFESKRGSFVLSSYVKVERFVYNSPSTAQKEQLPTFVKW